MASTPLRPAATVPVTPIVVRDGSAKPRSDVVAAEEPLEIRIQPAAGVERTLSITMRTPGNDFELAVGFLVAEGVVRSPNHVDQVKYCVGGPQEQQYNIVTVVLRQGARIDPGHLARTFVTSSACGVCGKASLEGLSVQDPPALPDGPVVDAATLQRLPGALRAKQRVFERTGGLHGAGLFEADGGLVLTREDVGRHNAVDKVVGSLVLGGTFPAGERVLQVSGRASYEIMQKALMAGIPFVSAVGAPSSLAVALAAEFGLTLVGFASDTGFNVYAGRERIRV
jgi:FdhD protein